MALSLSVIVPCRNRAEYLRATIDSILMQDVPGGVECIVIDAQSTDDTLDILKSYGDRIRWVSEPDAGHADAINKGWRMAHGDVLAWLNADDVYVAGAAREALAYLDANPPVDVVYGDCGAIDAAGHHFGYSYLRPWNYEYALRHCDNCIPQPSAFIRRRVLDRVGMLDTAFHQKKDHELWLRIASRGGVIRHMPRLWAHARAIRGLSFDGRTAAPACVQLVRRYTRERRAVSQAYLRGIDYARAGGGLRGLIGRYAAMALLTDPSNWRAVWGKVRGIRITSAQPQALSEAWEVEGAWLGGTVAGGSGEAMVLEPEDTVIGIGLAMRGWRTLVVAPRHRAWGYHHPKLRFLRDSTTTLQWPDGWFDLIVARDVDEPEAALRWLKPGGRLVFTSGRMRGDKMAWRRGEDGRWVVCETECGERFGGELTKDAAA